MSINKEKVEKLVQLYINELEDQDVMHAEIAHMLIDVFGKEDLVKMGFGEFIEDCIDLTPVSEKGLPVQCYGVLQSTGEVVIIKNGESGYYRTDINFGSKEENQELVDEYNKRLGVTKAQAAAMMVGSMFGWNVPGADPANYDENGHLKKNEQFTLEYINASGDIINRDYFDSSDKAIEFATFLRDAYRIEGSGSVVAFCITDSSGNTVWEDEVSHNSLEDRISGAEQIGKDIADKEIDMEYYEMTRFFREVEEINRGRSNYVSGYVVFTADSFTKEYSLAERTYVISSNNKAFMPNMGGYSIYGSSLEGSDINVRLESYMAAEKGGKDGWKVERCYMKQEEIDKGNNILNSPNKENLR